MECTSAFLSIHIFIGLVIFPEMFFGLLGIY